MTDLREIFRELKLHLPWIIVLIIVAVACEIVVIHDAESLWLAVACTVIMIPEAFLDSVYGKLYHRLSMMLFVSGIFLLFLFFVLYDLNNFGYYLGGSLEYFLVMLVIFIVSRGGLGGGDVCFSAGLGLYLGWENVWVSFFLTFISGFITVILEYAAAFFCQRQVRRCLPLGPFMAWGSFGAFLYGQDVIMWYMKLI